MNILKKTAFIAIILLGGLTANAQQKIAHVNSGDIIKQMSDYKIAEMVIDSMTNAIKAEIAVYQSEFQKKQEAYQALNRATTSEATIRLKEKELTDMDQRINEYAQNAQTELDNKKSELFDPIQKKLIVVIEQVSKEKGYAYVLDDQTLLVKPEADDITAAVKVKLGIKVANAPQTPVPTPMPVPKK